MTEQVRLIMMLLSFLFLQSCQTYHQVEVKPVEVKPIHITIDVNVKVDRALDNFFSDIDAAAEKETGTSPQPKPQN